MNEIVKNLESELKAKDVEMRDKVTELACTEPACTITNLFRDKINS